MVSHSERRWHIISRSPSLVQRRRKRRRRLGNVHKVLVVFPWWRLYATNVNGEASLSLAVTGSYRKRRRSLYGEIRESWIIRSTSPGGQYNCQRCIGTLDPYPSRVISATSTRQDWNTSFRFKYTHSRNDVGVPSLLSMARRSTVRPQNLHVIIMQALGLTNIHQTRNNHCGPEFNSLSVKSIK